MSYGTPGVYVEETTPQLTPIIQAGTGVSAFLGFTTRGPVHTPIALSSIGDFQRVFGASYKNETAENSLRGFFDNGGDKAYFSRMSHYDTTTGAETGTAASNTIVSDGTAPGSLKLEFGYRGVVSPGLAGNDYQITVKHDPVHISTGVNQDLSADITNGDDVIKVTGTVGIKPGTVLRLYDSTNDEEKIRSVRRVHSYTENSVVIHDVYLTSAVTADMSKALTIVESVEYSIEVLDTTGLVLETWDQLSLSDELPNNLPLVLNDPQLGSRYLRAVYTPGTDALGVLVLTDGGYGTGKALAGGTKEYLNFGAAHFEGTELIAKGLHSLDSISEINLLSCPPNRLPSTDSWSIKADSSFHSLMLEYCKSRMDLFAILDAPADKSAVEIASYRNNTLGLDSFWGALYYPHLKVQDPNRPQTSATLLVPPSGHVAGVYSRVDGMSPPQGGISAAAAGISEFGLVSGVVGIEIMTSDKQQATLNPAGVNCIRLLDRASGGKGIYILGARTLSTDINFKYVPMRRTLTFVEETVRLSTQFGIFKKNGPALWESLHMVISDFLGKFWQDGNLAGNKESEAFFVEINALTTTADDINNGIVRGRIGISLFRPAEFIVFTFTQTQSGSSVEEG